MVKLDPIGRIREDKLIKNKSNYSSYKWTLIAGGIMSLFFDWSSIGADLSQDEVHGHSLDQALLAFICFIAAYVFHEKLCHVKTILKYREREKELVQEKNDAMGVSSSSSTADTATS